MKRNQIIIISSVLLFFAIIYGVIIAKKKSPVKEEKSESNIAYVPVRKVKNVNTIVDIISYGQIAPNAQIDLSSEVQGKLLAGNSYLKPGMRFRKGQVLYRVDNQEATFNLSARKTQLANLLVNSLPDIDLDYHTELQKWSDFLNKIQPGKRLPELPEISSSRERMFVTSRGILAEYYNIKSLETRLDKYTLIAPFNGSVLATFAEPGAIVNPGSRIATIAKTDDFEVKVPLGLSVVKNYKSSSSVEFSTPEGQIVGYGSIDRISDVINRQTQSVDAYFNVKPVKDVKLYSGMYVNAVIHQKASRESFTVPRIALRDNQVPVLSDGKIYFKDVLIVGRKPDSLLVSGLQDGQMVVLDKVESDLKKTVFKGIAR